jgi:DNA-directed RNA polymerase specialized sigma24 family protein
MNTNRNVRHVPSTFDISSVSCRAGARAGVGTPPAGNDNAARPGVRDTTALVARPEIVRSVRATLRRHHVATYEMADAIADVQTEALAIARTREMPADVAQWRALATSIAVYWALDRRRQAMRRSRYDAGLCEDADVYPSATPHCEHRDPIDIKSDLAVLKELFDSGQMPERGIEILLVAADGAHHGEIAAEIGVSTSVVRGRLFRMRAKFRAELERRRRLRSRLR